MSERLPTEYELYQRREDESPEEYELFTEWARIPPSSRSVPNMARRTAVPLKKLKQLLERHEWETRAVAFDNAALALRPDPRTMDEEAAITAQVAASQILLDLGLRAIELKNPALISVDKASNLIKSAIELQRKALGQADLTVHVTGEDMSRVNELIGEVFDAEEVDDDPA